MKDQLLKTSSFSPPVIRRQSTEMNKHKKRSLGSVSSPNSPNYSETLKNESNGNSAKNEGLNEVQELPEEISVTGSSESNFRAQYQVRIS